ncbi:MAG TPA: hypothetical protein VIG25_15820 [Pyrinomonadaceae bacterium]
MNVNTFGRAHRGQRGNGSGKSAIEIGVFLEHVFSRAAEFFLQLSQLLFDTQNRQLLWSHAAGVAR